MMGSNVQKSNLVVSPNCHSISTMSHASDKGWIEAQNQRQL